MELVDNSGTGGRSLLPPKELLREEVFAKQTEETVEKLEESFRIKESVEVLTEMKTDELKKLERKKAVREQLIAARAREEQLKKEFAELASKSERKKLKATNHTAELRAKCEAIEKKARNYEAVVEKYQGKIDVMNEKIKRDKITQKIIEQFVEEQSIGYVVDPSGDQITGIKFWKIHPRRPNAECVLHMKKFTVTDLSDFEVDTVTPMFPEFEELAKEASESKNLVKLIVGCIKYWKNMYASLKGSK